MCRNPSSQAIPDGKQLCLIKGCVELGEASLKEHVTLPDLRYKNTRTTLVRLSEWCCKILTANRSPSV